MVAQDTSSVCRDISEKRSTRFQFIRTMFLSKILGKTSTRKLSKSKHSDYMRVNGLNPESGKRISRPLTRPAMTSAETKSSTTAIPSDKELKAFWNIDRSAAASDVVAFESPKLQKNREYISSSDDNTISDEKHRQCDRTEKTMNDSLSF